MESKYFLSIFMGHRTKFVFILFLLLFSLSDSFSQSKRALKQQRKYLSSYEDNTLSGTALPVLMPFNRWVDPAGEQLYFGDKERENHALDCAVSPDGKWIAVEGRYSIVIISPESKKIISRLVLKNSFPKENIANTFSGISWYKKAGEYELYWGATGKDGKSYVIQAGWDGKN
jgi:hypothetical protein